MVGDKIFKQLQYAILGKEQQVLNVLLAPAQGIYVDEAKIICCSEGLTKTRVKEPFCGEPVEYCCTAGERVDTRLPSGSSPTLPPPWPT